MSVDPMIATLAIQPMPFCTVACTRRYLPHRTNRSAMSRLTRRAAFEPRPLQVRAANRRLRAVLALAALALPLATAHAAQPAAACAQIGTDDTLRPIPESLVPTVNAVFGTRMPTDVAIRSTVFRCANSHVLVCTIGANLPCGPANTSRTPGAGEVNWCRDHPDAAFIPMVATGHDTIYAWRCHGTAPQIARQVQDVDTRGFIASYWRELP
jgi:hypothetical protein